VEHDPLRRCRLPNERPATSKAGLMANPITDGATDDRRVIVIGSGPSGAIAAATLIAAGIPVTLLESGRRTPRGLLVRAAGRTLLRGSLGRRDTSPYRSSHDGPATWLHVRTPGGLTNYWTGAVPRFAPQDFSDGGRLHERYVWPVTYGDLAPFYTRVERIIGVTGASIACEQPAAPLIRHAARLPAEWSAAATRASGFGQAFTPVPLAEGSPWMFVPRATAFNSFSNIVQPLRGDPRFQLKLGAHVLRLDWTGAKRRVTSVTYVDRADGSRHRVSAAAVVVAAGPLESTRLLLNSTSGDFPHGLGNTDDLLGRYLHDHPYDVSVVEFARPVPRLAHTINLTREPYESADPLLGTLATVGNTRMSVADRVLNLTPLWTRSLGLIIFGTMVPAPENRARISESSTDEFGAPLLELHVRFDDRTLANVKRGRDRAREVLAAAGRDCWIRPLIDRHVPGHSTHYGGTVRMHDSSRYGMLDGWNRLHAARNVVVADASAFTTGPEKNPTLTAMALSARAATRLASDLKSGIELDAP